MMLNESEHCGMFMCIKMCCYVYLSDEFLLMRFDIAHAFIKTAVGTYVCTVYSSVTCVTPGFFKLLLFTRWYVFMCPPLKASITSGVIWCNNIEHV